MESIENKVDYLEPSVQPALPSVIDTTAMPAATTESIKYAGFWIRFVAYMIDSLVSFIFSATITAILVFGFKVTSINGILKYFMQLIGFIFWFFYFVFMTMKYQATLGKMAVGIIVIPEKSENLRWGQIIGREALKFISALILYIGFIMAGFTEKKQALHDKIAKTLVIYKESNKKFGIGAKLAIIAASVLPVLLIIGLILWLVLSGLIFAKNKAKTAQDNTINPPISTPAGSQQAGDNTASNQQNNSATNNQNDNSQLSNAFLSKTPVNEVLIGYYGNIHQATLDRIKSIIEENFGVKVTLLPGEAQTFPEKDPFYDSKRKQFDSDYIWQSLSTLSTQYGQGVRQLFITDVDLFTKIQPERPYVFSRALPDTNTALISINRLLYVSDTDKNQAPSDLFDTRLNKLVSRTLGVTVGLSMMPSANDTNCVMYQFQNLADLDKTGANFCDDQKEALKKVFIEN